VGLKPTVFLTSVPTNDYTVRK